MGRDPTMDHQGFMNELQKHCKLLNLCRRYVHASAGLLIILTSAYPIFGSFLCMAFLLSDSEIVLVAAAAELI